MTLGEFDIKARELAGHLFDRWYVSQGKLGAREWTVEYDDLRRMPASRYLRVTPVTADGAEECLRLLEKHLILVEKHVKEREEGGADG